MTRNFIFYPTIAIVFFLLLVLSPLSGSFEPDSLFHFTISRLTAEEGLIRTLPQFEDIGWASYFTEKEFLFHQLTSWGYMIAGDQGVTITCHLLAVAILLLMVYIGEILSSKKISLTIILLMLLNVTFFFRLTMVRPHLGGMLFALIILLGLIQKNRWILGLGFFFFPLFYHAFYIPLIFLGCFLLVERFKDIKYYALYALLPLICGMLVNPYFPSTLIVTWMGIQIALAVSQSLNLGTEAQSLGLVGTIEAIGYIIVFTLAIFALRKSHLKDERNILSLLFITLTLIVCFFFSPRTIEYLIPLFSLLVIALVPILKKFQPKAFFLIIIALLATNSRFVSAHLKISKDVSHYFSQVEKLVKKLPTTGHEKVFNCEWDYGALIFYHRPNLKMVDILDPNFIYLHSIQIGKLRDLLLVNPPNDYHKILVEGFKADYLLCQNPALVNKVKNDPRFELISENRNPDIYLYRIYKD